MNYNSCPLCKNLVSAKTIEKIRICNNCKAEEKLNKYLNDKEFLLSKTKNQNVAKYVPELIKFLKQSTLVYSQQNRIVIDFLKIMNLSYNQQIRLSEEWVENKYFTLSAIKSPNALDCIKAFLNSKGEIDFDSKSKSFYPLDTRHVKRFKSDIVDYYFSDSRCHDCGLNLNTENHSFCYNCVAYRSIYNRTTIEYVENKFSNNSVKGLYWNFCNFIYSLGRKPQTTAEIFSNSNNFFSFLEKYVPDNLHEKPFFFGKREIGLDIRYQVIDSNPFIEFSFTNEWLDLFDQEFKGKNKYFSIFLAFLENVGLVKPLEVDPKKKIALKIDTVELVFQKPILGILEKEAAMIDLLIKKNATFSKKWITVEHKISQLISFYNWIIDNYSVKSWAEVSENMVNIFLLRFPETSREIRKRTLFNFFEYAKKHRHIFYNPIEKFIARDRMVAIKPLSKYEHAKVFSLITNNVNELFVEKLISSLVYFHALKTKQITEIKLEDILVEKKCIIIKGRPPVYLSKVEMLLLHLMLSHREDNMNGKKSTYLFWSSISIKDTPITGNTIGRYVKSITGLSPKSLRIASLQYCAYNFGAEYLHDCLGLSLTQSGRYANIAEWLLEETIEDELEG